MNFSLKVSRNDGGYLVAVLDHKGKRRERVLTDWAETTLMSLTDWLECVPPIEDDPSWKPEKPVRRHLTFDARLDLLLEQIAQDGHVTPRSLARYQGVSAGTAGLLIQKALFAGTIRRRVCQGHAMHGQYELAQEPVP